jgi:hypothetical protein
MNRSSLAIVSLLGLSAPALGVDTPAVSQWLVTSAKATGANGELFVTSLRIVNPGAAPANVDLFFYPRINFDQGTNSAPGDNTSPPKKSVTVPPGQTLQIDDVLATQFGRTGPSDSGAIRLESDVPVSVLSQTLVANAKSSAGVPGTNGFAIPAQLIDNAIAVGDTGFVPYLSSAPDRTAGYRSNLFLFAASSSVDTIVNVKLLKGSDGSTVGSRDVTLGKMVQTQINDIGRVYGFTDLFTNLTAVLTVTSGGPVFTGASVIDNAISSQIYTPPTKKWLPNKGLFGLLLSDGGYGFAGRLDIPGGLPDFMTLPLVMDNCPASPGPEIQLYFVQAFGSGSDQNATFSVNADGSYSVTGQTKDATATVDATFSGTIQNNVDGTIQGTITYTRSAGTAGGRCPGASKDFPFVGARVAPYTGS